MPEGCEIPRPSGLLDSLLRLRRDIVGGDHLIFLRVREVAAILLTWGAVEDPELSKSRSQTKRTKVTSGFRYQ
jgi:hypothetical protein